VAREKREETHHLTLLRHAKSSWSQSGVEDHERPLNARGEHAARLLAAYFAEREPPDLVLCSSARRTQQTLEPIAAALRPRPRIVIEDVLYLASPIKILRRISEIEDEVKSALVLGHNPALHELASALAAHSPRRLRAKLSGKFPTGAAAAFRFSGPWSGIAHASLIMTELVTPADLAADVENDD